MLSLQCYVVLFIQVLLQALHKSFSRTGKWQHYRNQWKKYGSELLGQQYTDIKHMWGRIMNIDVTTYVDDKGQPVMYASPSNLSPASEQYQEIVAERVEKYVLHILIRGICLYLKIW